MLQQKLTDPSAWSWAQVPAVQSLDNDDNVSSSPSGMPDSLATVTWRACSKMPSEIHAELLAANMIPNPLEGSNEQTVQWVGEADCVYRCTFDIQDGGGRVPEAGLPFADLVFEGLDTFATVYLNGTKVLSADNMFRSWRVSVAEHLKKQGNTLYVVFRSAFRRGRELEIATLGRDKHWPCWNGDPSRLFTRKAGYHYGWDWGPTLMAAGPYRPVRLERYEVRITDFWPRATVSADLEPRLSLSWQTSARDESVSVAARLVSSTGTRLRQATIDNISSGGPIEWSFDSDEVELWWTHDQGSQPLYEVQLDLVDERSGKILDSISRKVAFRQIEVVRAPLDDAEGRSFVFVLNKRPLFLGGSNWIPIDSFPTTGTPERYRSLLALAREGNQSMIRVWGGGIYEESVFYDTCDELGLLVWQDFMFACAAYPAHLEAFRRNVEAEALEGIKRLRHHACLAIFAGNNEDYQIAEAEKLEYDPSDRSRNSDWLATSFPARELYERIFPALVEAHCDTFYWPGSPWSEKNTRDQTEGDLHCWDVWHGSQEPYQEYGRLGGRFVSEFGMQGCPDAATVEAFFDEDDRDRQPESLAFARHNKAIGWEGRLAKYIADNVRCGPSLDDYVYATQFVQAEAVTNAFSAWRSKFKGGVAGAQCAGALIWQLNDVWPCTSWSIIDYFERPKPAYYTAKRALAPVALYGQRSPRRVFPDPTSATVYTELVDVHIGISSSRLTDIAVEIDLIAFDLATGKRVREWRQQAHVQANRSTNLLNLELPSKYADPEQPIVISATVSEHDTQNVSARLSLWPEPYKYLKLPAAKEIDLHVEIGSWETDHRGRRSSGIRINAARPVKGLVLRSCDGEARFSDNFLDIMPGHERFIVCWTEGAVSDIEWRYLGSDL